MFKNFFISDMTSEDQACYTFDTMCSASVMEIQLDGIQNSS